MNQYIEKIAQFEKSALRKIISELAKGNVTTKLEELVRRGAVKPVKAYEKGMKQGNIALAKKIGVTVQRPRAGKQFEIANRGSGYMTTFGEQERIYAGRKTSSLLPTKLEHQGMVRHELFEAAESKAYKKATGAKSGAPATVFAKEVSPGRVQSQGLHASPRVLTMESEMVRKNPHLAAKFHSVRGRSGESGIIKRITGKRYGMDKMTSKDHLRAHTTAPDSYVNYNGVTTAAFKQSLPKQESGLMSKLREQFKQRYGE